MRVAFAPRPPSNSIVCPNRISIIRAATDHHLSGSRGRKIVFEIFHICALLASRFWPVRQITSVLKGDVMQAAVRPYLGAGIALVGAGAIALSPISPVVPSEIHL